MRYIWQSIRAVLAAVSLVAVGMAAPAQAQAPKKIVFLAGPKEHGAPGRHEYRPSLTLCYGVTPSRPTFTREAS